MKKLLVLFLLAFPILIFAIVNISASIIGWYISPPVEKIEVSLDNLEWSNKIHVKESELAGETKDVDIYFRVLPNNARNHKVKVYVEDVYTSNITILENKEDSQGVRLAKISLLEYGYNEIHIITEDGNYQSVVLVSVENPNDDPNEVKSIFLEYKTALHQHYEFGNSNELKMNFTYFPQGANQAQVLNQIATTFNGVVVDKQITGPGEGYFALNFNNTEREQTFIATTPEGRSSKFTFNVNEGLNIKGHSFEQIAAFTTSGNDVYQLEEFNIPAGKQLVISKGIKYDGNNFKITRKEFTEAELEIDPQSKSRKRIVTAVRVVDHNTRITRVHVVGPLEDVDGQNIPYENFINMTMSGSKVVRYQEITKSVIENGRYNLSLSGASVKEGSNFIPAEFKVEDVKFIGALMAGINVDNSIEGALEIFSTRVTVKNLQFEWAGVGMLLQNSRSAELAKGFSEIVIKKSDNPDLINSLDTTNNWRNLDEASGILSEQNMPGLLDELKKYDEVIHKEGRYYFVSPIIMKRGGAVNHSRIVFEDPQAELDFKVEERRPSTIEAMHPAIGGRAPFVVYLLDPKYYVKKGDKNEAN